MQITFADYLLINIYTSSTNHTFADYYSLSPTKNMHTITLFVKIPFGYTICMIVYQNGGHTTLT